MERAGKREELIEAAIRLFNRHGFHATGVDRLMQETGIAKTTLYRHFPSKDALIVAVLERLDEDARAEMREFVETASDDPKGRILATFDLLARWIEDPDFKGCPFIAAAGEFGGAGLNPVLAQVRLHKRLYLAFFEELVRAARLAEPERVAAQLVMLHEGAIACALALGPRDFAQAAKAAAARLLAGARSADD